MDTMRWPATLLMVALLVPAACGGPADLPLPTGTLTFGTSNGLVRMPVEIADTPGARRKGLMDRTSLPPDAGMAFLFDGPDSGAFWMKDTLIPLSVAFWGQDGRILVILDMDPCRADPCALYSPGASYVGAVEANRGYFGAHGIGKGDLVALTR
jgi:uncharacterized membrane protein (UPF0127 family)